MNNFTIKEGVNIRGLHISMRKVLKAASRIWKEAGQELVVTAGLDGDHSQWSFHYYGRAVDLRSRYFSAEEVWEVVNKLHDAIGSDYDIIVHTTHIHVEYDPVG